MSYDPKCLELAEYFLPSFASDRLKSDLAQEIQDAVEDYCSRIRARMVQEVPRD